MKPLALHIVDDRPGRWAPGGALRAFLRRAKTDEVLSRWRHEVVAAAPGRLRAAFARPSLAHAWGQGAVRALPRGSSRRTTRVASLCPGEERETPAGVVRIDAAPSLCPAGAALRAQRRAAWGVKEKGVAAVQLADNLARLDARSFASFVKTLELLGRPCIGVVFSRSKGALEALEFARAPNDGASGLVVESACPEEVIGAADIVVLGPALSGASLRSASSRALAASATAPAVSPAPTGFSPGSPLSFAKDAVEAMDAARDSRSDALPVATADESWIDEAADAYALPDTASAGR